MGYTHYWQGITFTDSNWEKLHKDVRKLFKSLPVNIQREYDNSSRPLVGKDAIVFNGVGNDGHETFFLSKGDPEFSFCKTSQKPYDLAVCCVLMLASVHGDMNGKDVGISSDGINAAHGQYPDNIDSEWIEAFSHFKNIFPKIGKEKAFRLFREKEMICRIMRDNEEQVDKKKEWNYYTVVYSNDYSAVPDVFFIATDHERVDIVTSESFDGDEDTTDVEGNEISKEDIEFLKRIGICELAANESVNFYKVPKESELKII